MTEKHTEMVLTDKIEIEGMKLQALYLPKDSYQIFHEKDDGTYNELTSIRVMNENLCLENINTYFNYPSSITDSSMQTDITSIINHTLLIMSLQWNMDESNAKEILEKVFTELNNTMEFDENYNEDALPEDEFKYTTIEHYKKLGENEQTIFDRIKTYKDGISNIELDDLKLIIKDNMIKTTKQKYTQHLLAKYLSKKYGIILRKNTGDIYKLDGMGYTHLNHDDLVIMLKDDFGSNIVHDEDIIKALGYISQRLEPQYNIVKFKDCLYNMDEGKVIDPTEPIFTLIESPYRYNPNATSTILKKFLESSLEKKTESGKVDAEETAKTIKGVMQIIGYFFTSGNKYNIMPICTGVGGSGKTVFTNILTEIFGKDRIADLSLQEMEKNIHGTSSLVNKHLNFIRDSDDSMIENISFIKQITGNEQMQVNPKYKNPYVLPKEEVPKTMLICNSIPRFKVYKEELIIRFVVIEFLNKFRGTDKQNPNLEKEILEDDEEIEWLIYQSLEAYKEITKLTDFNLKLNNEDTMELIEKHTEPLNHLLSMLIEKHDPKAWDTEIKITGDDGKTPIYTDDLSKVMIKQSEILGLSIPLKKDKIPPRKLMSAIKTEFDLWDGEIVGIRGDDGRIHEVNRKYITQPYRRNNKTARIYPNLIGTDKYAELLKKIQEEDDKD